MFIHDFRFWLIIGTALSALIIIPAMGQQLNFILYYPDQLRAHEVGCYGNTVAQTPNMDSLAASGVRFEFAVPGLPVCTPARACVLTGRMPFSVRSSSAGHDWMVVNSIDMHTNEITIAEELNQLGYTCGHVGAKWHVQEAGGLSCIGDRQGFAFLEGLNSYGRYDEPKYCDNNYVLQTEPGRWNADVMTDRAINFITANQNNSFYLNIWHSPPHAPRNLHWGQYHFDDPNNPERLISWTFDNRLDLWNNSPELSDLDLRPNIIPSLMDEAKRQIREYNALTTGIDQCLGRIRTTLQTLGIADRTIIIESADHGSQLGSHATAFETTVGWEKNEIYDESILVPLIVYDPRQAPPAHVRSELIHQMDLLPTIVELAGGTAQRAQGRSFAPLITGQGTYQPRDAVLVQYNGTNLAGTGYGWSRALRTNDWKYAVAEVSGNPQGIALFDLQNDPYETNNRINQPAYSIIQSQLHNRIITEMQQLADPLVVPPQPVIELSIDTINISIAKGLNPPDDSFTITNTYVGTLNYTINKNALWLSTIPNSGTLAADETDNVIIDYSTTALGKGVHSATISVEDPNAPNSPQEIAVSLNVFIPGDFDLDDDVDQEDFGKFQTCLSGIAHSYPEGCEDADFNKDGDVDLSDFNLLYNCMSRPNVPSPCL
ncbi:MAG: sulfatase-like hydrolase/transferase [Planctomycetota bacterium]|nr:MAG: sulfatase-like hydrolase/transferase [Planctomycetota bacterium]